MYFFGSVSTISLRGTLVAKETVVFRVEAYFSAYQPCQNILRYV